MSVEKKRRVENLFPDVLDAWKAVFGESSFCRALPAAYELLDAVNCGSLNWPHGQIVSPVNGVSKSFVAMLVWLVQRKERKMGESTDAVLKRSVQEYFGVTSFTATMALDLKNKAMPTRENLEPTVRRFSKSYGAFGRFRGSAVKAVTSLADLRAFLKRLEPVGACQSVHHKEGGASASSRLKGLRFNICEACWQKVSSGALVHSAVGYSSMVKISDVAFPEPTLKLLKHAEVLKLNHAVVVGMVAIDTLAQLKVDSAVKLRASELTENDLRMFGLLTMAFPTAVPVPNSFEAMRLLFWWDPEFVLPHLKKSKRLAQLSPEFKHLLGECLMVGAVETEHRTPRGVAVICGRRVRYLPYFMITRSGWLVDGAFAWWCKALFLDGAAAGTQFKVKVVAAPRCVHTAWDMPLFGKLEFKKRPLPSAGGPVGEFVMKLSPLVNVHDWPTALVALYCRMAEVAAISKKEKKIRKMVTRLDDKEAAAKDFERCPIIIFVELHGCPFSEPASILSLQSPRLMMALAEFYKMSDFNDQLPKSSLFFSWIFGVAVAERSKNVSLEVLDAYMSPLLNPAVSDEQRATLESMDSERFCVEQINEDAGMEAAESLAFDWSSAKPVKGTHVASLEHSSEQVLCGGAAQEGGIAVADD